MGEITAAQIADFFANEENRQELAALKELGIDPKEEPKEQIDGVFTGEKVVLTGKLSSLTRGEAQKLIEGQGGECLSSVTAKTTLVVAGEDAGSKLAKAQKLGVKIVGEEEFLAMVQGKN